LFFYKGGNLILERYEAAQSVVLTFLTFVHASNFYISKLLVVIANPTAQVKGLWVNLPLEHLNQIAATFFTQQLFIKQLMVVLAHQEIFFNVTDLPLTDV